MGSRFLFPAFDDFIKILAEFVNFGSDERKRKKKKECIYYGKANSPLRRIIPFMNIAEIMLFPGILDDNICTSESSVEITMQIHRLLTLEFEYVFFSQELKNLGP